MATPLKKPEEIREVLAQACRRKELLILATPYLRFESNFLALEGDELHVLATMSREDAVYGLRTPDLLLRFPQGLGFYESPVHTVGLGLYEGRRTVRLALPKLIRENDQRVAYRVERVGRVEVTFSTPKANLHTAALLDISTSGAKLHTHSDQPGRELEVGDRVTLTIPLSAEIRIETSALVRHQRARTLGLQFHPPLPPEVQEPLSRWVFLHREEERERLARRLELASEAQRQSGMPEASILLLSPDPGLGSELKEALQGLRPLVQLPAAAQPLKDALLNNPVLVVIHLREGAGLDERRRLKTLVEMARRKVPILVLGTGVEGATLYDLSTEWRASSAIAWSPGRAAFFLRLVAGILRRHAEGGDAPIAPAEY